MGQSRNGRTLRSRIGRFAYRLVHSAPFLRENDPVDKNEWLLRRVPNSYIDNNLSPPFTRVTFRPSNYDVDGISLFREMFISSRVLSSTGKSAPYVVARVRASDIFDMNLSIVPSPDMAQPPGHVSVPEISIGEMKRDKAKSKEYQHALTARSSVGYCPKLPRSGSKHSMSMYVLQLVAA